MDGENIWKKDMCWRPKMEDPKTPPRQSERNPSIHPIDPSEGTKETANNHRI
jgi:hypothetical protein